MPRVVPSYGKRAKTSYRVPCAAWQDPRGATSHHLRVLQRHLRVALESTWQMIDDAFRVDDECLRTTDGRRRHR